MGHEDYMREAIRLALDTVRYGRGGPFGAVVVRDGEIIGMGNNQVTPTLDPTAHAEVVAIRNACREVGDFRLDGGILYTSCEPCPMCLGAIYWARLVKVYYGASREDAAKAGFDDALIYRELPLPPERRVLAMERLLEKEVGVVFQEWREKPDKVPY